MTYLLGWKKKKKTRKVWVSLLEEKYALASVLRLWTDKCCHKDNQNH